MSKNVSFRRDSPPGGSHYDHQRSDSGVGSFSGDESRSSRADRPYTPSDYDNPIGSVYVLQEALNRERISKEKWKKKATELDAQVIQARKDFKEKEAQWRAATDRTELLDQEKAALLKKIVELNEELAKLKDDKDQKRSSRRKSNSSPVMSGAINTESSDDKKPRRSSSKRRSTKDSERTDREREKGRIDKEIERELEREKDRETERLRKRFDSRAEESDAKSSNSSKSQRSRRDSYIEPLGHGAPRPQVQVPASPSARPYPPYPSATAAYTQQPYATSKPPRAAHPSVMVYQDAFVDDEDGNYHHYPLPSHKSSRRGDRV